MNWDWPIELFRYAFNDAAGVSPVRLYRIDHALEQLVCEWPFWPVSLELSDSGQRPVPKPWWPELTEPTPTAPAG